MTGENAPAHEPVLVEAVVSQLAVQPGEVVFDGTLGLGGHAATLIPRIAPHGTYIGVDLDEQMLVRAQSRLVPLAAESNVRLHLVHGNFAALVDVLQRVEIQQVDAMLFDLGVNSAQLDEPQRGFSFDREGPLDMRFDGSQRRQALDLVNGLGERELADLIYDYGQERMSRKIARRIVAVRRAARITTTQALANLVYAVFAAEGKAHSQKIHPATRTFQALRIAVNEELDNLKQLLATLWDNLRPDGRVAIISFHSLEDGLVKHAFRDAKQAGLAEVLTKSPLGAEPDERDRNPRSRSAKLRAARRVA